MDIKLGDRGISGSTVSSERIRAVRFNLNYDWEGITSSQILLQADVAAKEDDNLRST